MNRENKILFVDDDLNPQNEVNEEVKNILREFKSILENFGDIIEAYSYEGAIEKLCKENFSLAVVDILLPEKDENYYLDSSQYGKNLIKKLVNRDIPVIGISNKTDRTTVSELMGPQYNVIAIIDKSSQRNYKEKFENYIQMALKPKKRNRFCSYINKICNTEFSFFGEKSIFILSSKNNEDKVHSIYDYYEYNGKYNVHPWTHFESNSGLIYCNHVCPKIYGHNIILAEISDKNPNVAFEVGFAFGLGRNVILLRRKNGSKDIEDIIKDLSYKEYENINDIEEILGNLQVQKYKIYAKPKIFFHIDDFENPEKRKKEKFFIVSWEKPSISIRGIPIESIQINKYSFIELIKKLINAKGLIFDIESLNQESTFAFFLISGICVAQGIPLCFYIKNIDNAPIDIHQLIKNDVNRVKQFLKEIPL